MRLHHFHYKNVFHSNMLRASCNKKHRKGEFRKRIGVPSLSLSVNITYAVVVYGNTKVRRDKQKKA